MSLTATAPARAEWTAGADAALTLPIGEADTNVGWLAAAHVGYRLHFRRSIVIVGPEVGGGYGVYTPIASARKATGFFYGGGLFALGFESLMPFAKLRLGYGVASTTDLPDANPATTFSSGAYVDGALGVAKRLTRAFELGVEAGYATIEPGGCYCARWVHAGAVGTFIF